MSLGACAGTMGAMVTDEELSEATREVTRAEDAVRAAGSLGARQTAEARLAEAVYTATSLRERRADQERRAAERAERVRAADRRLRAAGRTLDEAESRLVDALTAAQGALVAVCEVAGGLAVEVDRVGALLRELQLPLGEGDETGVGAGAVRLAGMWHAPLSPGALLVWLDGRVRSACLGTPPAPYGGTGGVDWRARGLLGRVPAPGGVVSDV